MKDVNDLQKLIRTLQRRMKTRRNELTRNESKTRCKLIDPLLQGMGWNTRDRAQVKQEYQLGAGRADYALFTDAPDKPAVVVEAKKLSISRSELDKAAKQGIGYCIEDGIKYFAVTDGQIWEVYKTHKKVRLLDKLIMSFNLASPLGEAAMDCARARELWRLDVDQGNGTDSDEETVVQPEPQPLLPPPPDHPMFVHGMRVDAEGYILTKSGRRDKRYSSEPYLPGPKWVVGGSPLDEEGWVLTPKGNRATKFKYPCPTNTKRILNWGRRRHFLDADGYVLTKSGERDGRYTTPYPPGAVEFVDGRPLDKEGYVLTKSGKRDGRYTWPYREYDI